MTSTFGLLGVLMGLISGGGGNDLLDYLPTEAYWKARGVALTVEAMAGEAEAALPAEIPRLIRQLGAKDYQAREEATRKLRAIGPAAVPALQEAAKADDPEVRMRAREALQGIRGGREAQAVRRLMAIRALGEMGKPEALPLLRRLAGAEAPFAADYARRAIAAVEGKPYERPQPEAAAAWSDVCVLPRGCGVVAQFAMPPGGPGDFEKALQGVAPMVPGGAEASKMLEELARVIGGVAETVGNIRLHGVTVGVAGDIGDDAGFVVVVGRGLYDPEAVAEALREAGATATEVGGMEVFAPEGEVCLIPCSPRRFVAAFGPGREHMPIEELVAALRAERAPDEPALGPKLQALIASVDTEAPCWAVATITEAYGAAPLLAPFDTVTLAGKQGDDGALALTLVARGTDVPKVEAAVATFRQGLEEAKREVGEEAGRMPALKPIAEFLDSVAVECDGAKAVVSASLQSPTAVMLAPLLLFTAGRRAAPPPAHPPPPPVLREKAHERPR
ncbi:MAG: HEAT repeat domain-containing protein [Candidatus Brocadiia bacterium]